MKKVLVSSHALLAAVLLCLGLEKASAQIDPSAKPVSTATSLVTHPGAMCAYGY
ncbi:MAG TPA: hypothetical protein VGL42_01830 [Opitutaceae bacterium]